MDIKEIQSLIKFVAKSGANEVKLEMEDIKITIKTGSERTEVTYTQPAPMMAAPQVIQAAPVETPIETPKNTTRLMIRKTTLNTLPLNHLLLVLYTESLLLKNLYLLKLEVPLMLETQYVLLKQ